MGAAAMASVSKLEQQSTQRPDSYIPAHTLARLFGLEDPDRGDWGRNMAMHHVSGAIGGVIRGVMSAANLRGPFASLMHANIRLSFDKTLENATRAGAPPWTQRRDELAIDLGEKSAFALVTGLLTDALVAPLPQSSVQRRHLGRRLKGRA